MNSNTCYISVGKVTFVEPVKEGSFFIEFSTSEMANNAVKNMHRHEINGRNIVVKKVRS